MQVSLVMFKADGTRREFRLKKQRTVIGRKNNCDLRIPLSSVSRQHCEVLLKDDQITLRDLGSSNGTYHNHIRVQEATLEAGDEVVVGPVVFTVLVDGEPEDIEPVRTLVRSDDSTGSQAPPADLSPVGELDLDDEDFAAIESEIESELTKPEETVDEDPIAALERLAEAERIGKSSDDSDLDFDIDLDDDEDDKRT